MRTRPDSNVRPARRLAAQSARATGRYALARLLLGISAKLLLLAAVTSSMPACIIPVGPDFQDPEGLPNYPPEILNPDPTWGQNATGTATATPTFSLTLFDQNADDTMYLRWIVDGMRSGDDLPIPSGATMHPESRSIGCFDVHDRNAAVHTIIAVVGDRPLSISDLLAVADPSIGKANHMNWQLNLNCAAAP